MLILLFDICMPQQANLDKVSMQVTLCVNDSTLKYMTSHCRHIPSSSVYGMVHQWSITFNTVKCLSCVEMPFTS